MVFVLFFAAAAFSQPRAIGFRLGGTADVSYQQCFKSDNFLEIDAGVDYLGKKGANLTAVYDFVFASVRKFSFYAGPGAHIGYYNDEVTTTYTGEEPRVTTTTVQKFALGITGQVGGEYAFERIPLNLSIDWRPAWHIVGGLFDPYSICLGVRYRF